MEINEIEINKFLNVMEYGIKYYSAGLRHKFTMLEYYALTDLTPSELAMVAQGLETERRAAGKPLTLSDKKRNSRISLALRCFDLKYEWENSPLKIDEVMRCNHSICGREITQEDKLTIINTLKQEGYPLVRGVYYPAVHNYYEKGAEGLLKENIINDIYNAYCDKKKIKRTDDVKIKSLTKK